MLFSTRKVKCPNCKKDLESSFSVTNQIEFGMSCYFHCLECHSLYKSSQLPRKIIRNVSLIMSIIFLFPVSIISFFTSYSHLKRDGLIFSLPLSSSLLLGSISALALFFIQKIYRKGAYGKLKEIENKEFELQTKRAAEEGTLSTHSFAQGKKILQIILIALFGLLFLNFQSLLE